MEYQDEWWISMSAIDEEMPWIEMWRCHNVEEQNDEGIDENADEEVMRLLMNKTKEDNWGNPSKRNVKF